MNTTPHPAGRTEEGARPQAVRHLLLPPDHNAGGSGSGEAHRVLRAGETARSLFTWCHRHAVEPQDVVQAMAAHLAERWSAYARPEPGETLGQVLQRIPERVVEPPPESAGALTLAVRAAPDTAAGAEMTLSASWDAGTLDPRTVAAFLDSLHTLMTGWLADPGADLGSLPLLSPTDTGGLLSLGDGGAPTHAPYRTVVEAIADRAERHPRRPAVRFAGRTLTYEDLIRQAQATAAGLRAAGVGAGARVLLYGAQSDLTVVGMLACHLLGAAYVPLDVESPGARLEQVATGTGAAACLWADEATATARGAEFLPEGTPLVPVTLAPRAAQPSVHRPPEPSAAAYVLFSSGTTGVPKGIEVSQRSLAHFCREINAAYAIGDEDRVLAFARPVFDVSVFEVFATLAAGARVVIPDADARLDPMLLTDVINEEGVTLAELPPALLPLLDAAELPTLRMVSVGGEAVAGALVAEWDSPERELWNGYGPTETTVAVTLQRLTGEWTVSPPIGRPLPGCTAFVVDEELRLRPRGAVGELCIAGPSLATGYLDDPERTAAAFVELPEVPGTRVYRTGDLARWRGDGALDYLGRIDRQVKVNGFRVEPAEVEGVLAAATGVRQAVVEMAEAAGGGRILGALVVGGADLDHATVLEQVRRTLPPYAVPGRLVRAEALPLTANGKVDRAEVRRMLGAR
ncbi:amino acid adenylation domain-containing protein [Streptomyces sp. NPDC086989]